MSSSPEPEAEEAVTVAHTDHERIQTKIDTIYGVRQTRAGVEFHTNLPGASALSNSVAPQSPRAMKESTGSRKNL